MKILPSLRKPYLATFLAGLILLVSCKQEAIIDSPEMSFNYEIFESLKSEKLTINYPLEITEIKSEIDKRKAMLNFINEKYNSALELPDNLFLLDNNTLKNNYSDYLSELEIELINNFEADLISNDFDYAIESFEENVLAVENLTSEQFEKFNNLANVILLIENENPEIFGSSQNRDPLGCIVAIISHFIATLGLSACQPGALLSPPCLRAVASWGLTIIAMNEACGNEVQY